ncbi:MAG: hypothetical protein ACUZ8N_13340 [Candidatus Scalindua sp.]
MQVLTKVVIYVQKDSATLLITIPRTSALKSFIVYWSKSQMTIVLKRVVGLWKTFHSNIFFGRTEGGKGNPSLHGGSGKIKNKL